MEKLGAILPEGVMSPNFQALFWKKCEKKRTEKSAAVI